MRTRIKLQSIPCVGHKYLELEHYGFRGIINDWFSSYLSNRRQTTELKCHISNKATITCGVSQGSVLAPLLSLLYAFFFFCILLVFIDLSYLQELLQTKRLYTTSYIGVIVIYKKINY